MKHSCNYINGKWIDSNEGEEVTSRNPADLNEKVFKTKYADENLAIEAVESAQTAWQNWRHVSFKDRAEFVKLWLNKLEVNRDEIARSITLENGKLLHESQSEIRASLSEGQYQIKFLSENLNEVINGSEIHYESIGPVLLITPWNFPIATILRKLLPALLVGNTAVVKSSEFAPYSSFKLFQLLEDIDFPSGVVNLIVGRGDKLVPPMIESKKLRAVSFTGSVTNGQLIARELDPVLTRYQAELGGNNTVVVLKDADLNEVADAVIGNGFACSGQWCTGTGRIIAESEIHDKLTELLLERINNIKIGNGLDAEVTMGPLINDIQLKRVEEAVNLARREGAKILCGGKKPVPPELKNGNFFEPTLITEVTSKMSIADTEIFGPVITVMKVRNLDEALEITKSSKYGLAFSIYTENKGNAERAVREVEAGVCHVNLPTTFRDVALPLLGWKNSGIGLPESGRFMRDFFTRTKTLYRG